MREHPRVDCDDVSARYRKDEGGFALALVGDLSAGGARLLGVEGLEAGDDIDVVVVPRHAPEIAVKARVMRVSGGIAGVRFIDVSDDQWRALDAELRPRLSRMAPAHVVVEAAPRAVSGAELQRGVIYDRLGLEPSCSDEELRESAEMVLAAIETALGSATGERRECLLAAGAALERMRPLWTDKAARAAYDRRCG